nr:MAG TPA: hypothetical protein [Bacteriophage sp.]
MCRVASGFNIQRFHYTNCIKWLYGFPRKNLVCQLITLRTNLQYFVRIG